MGEPNDFEVDLTRGLYRRVYSGSMRDRRLCSIPLEAEAWFWRLHCVADDFGVFVAEPDLCRDATVGRRSEVTIQQVDQWLAAMGDAGLVTFYTAGGERFGEIVGFTDFQPAGKNGKRVRRFPVNPGESRGEPVNPGESKEIPVRRSQSGPAHKHEHKQEHHQDQKHLHSARVERRGETRAPGPSKNGHAKPKLPKSRGAIGDRGNQTNGQHRINDDDIPF